MYLHDWREDFEAWRDWLNSTDAVARATRHELEQAAARVRRLPPMAVTDKHDLPYAPHEDPHDYVSIATYYWPNPDTPDGLPWMCRDGQISPAVAKYDRLRWDVLADGVSLLVRAAALLDRPDHADHAAAMLRRWFIEPETAMNPHLAHAQFVPARRAGSRGGIIDFSTRLPDLFNHVLLLEHMRLGSWSADDAAALRQWSKRLLHWLCTSDFGQGEDQATNNHAVYHDRIVAFLALHVGDHDTARNQLERVFDRRIAMQIEPDGSMPRELRRTLTFGYTLMNLLGLVDLARLGEHVGLDLWHIRTDDGRGIEQALRFFYDHAASTQPWPYKHIETIWWERLIPLLHRARRGYGDMFPLSGVRHRFTEPIDPRRWMMLADLHPFHKGVTDLGVYAHDQ